MLATKQEMMDVLTALAPVRIINHELGTVEIEMPIPSVGLSPVLRKLLRVAARNDVAVALARRDGLRRAWSATDKDTSARQRCGSLSDPILTPSGGRGRGRYSGGAALPATFRPHLA